jgi:chromosome segregation ATPase
VDEVLLTVLNETLNEIAEEMRSAQSNIEKRQAERLRAQKEVKLAEDREKCATYEDEQATRRVEALRTYLNRLGDPPRILLSKMKKLSDEQERTARERDAAGGQIARAANDLRARHTELAVAEQRYAELQKLWGEVSEHISNAQRSV